MAIVVYWMGIEAQNSVSIPDTAINERYHERYISGCESIYTEVMAGFIEKAENFTFRDITVLRELADEHTRNQPVQTPLDLEQKNVELAQDTFDLTVKRIGYDCDVYEVSCLVTKLFFKH